MSRHRNVRTLNVQEEYDGYFDVYGHSVEDDYCISPSVAEFMYDRNRKHQISSLLSDESQIKEDEEWNTSEQDIAGHAGTGRSSFSMPALNADEEVKLKSCLDELQNIVGESIPEPILIESVLKNEFDFEKSLQAILSQSTTASSQALPPNKKVEKREDHASIHINSELNTCMSECRIINDACKKSGCEPPGTNVSSILQIEKCTNPLNEFLNSPIMAQATLLNTCNSLELRKDNNPVRISEDFPQVCEVASGNSPLQSLASHYMKDASKKKFICHNTNSKVPSLMENAEFSALSTPVPITSSTSQLQALASVRLQTHDTNVGSTFVVPKLFSGTIITCNKNKFSNSNVEIDSSNSLKETVVHDSSESNSCKANIINPLIYSESDHKIDLALAVRFSDTCLISDSEESAVSNFSRKSYITQFDTYKLSVPPQCRSATCSNVGKLLSLRLRTKFLFPFPYSSMYSGKANIPRFTFKVPSPDSVVLNLRKSTQMT